MRIIAGSARSMPLKAPDGMDTRPTTDRIKETLFNIIQGYIPGAYFLDLFAGSGSVGLEAVSRGAKKAVFVDNNRKACACIQDNINFTKFNSKCDLKCMDAISALRTLERRYVFDVIFIDPPYGKGLASEALMYLKNSSIVSEDTIMIVEESIECDLSEFEIAGLDMYRDKQYKTNRHMFFKINKES